MIIAIVLAAGESTRMSGNTGIPTLKQLLPYGKSTILESVIQALLYSKVDRIVVVLGHEASLVRKKIKKYKVDIVVNEYYKNGMLSSIQCGVEYAHTRFNKNTKTPDGVMICLGDQPSIHLSVIKKLITRFQKTSFGILIPVYRKRRGHPVFIRSAYCNEILGLPLEKGLRELMLKYSSDILEVPVQSSSILKDIDTPEEYKEAVRKVK
jgi:molybdenum cofactor cytidylyltransferase